MPTYVDDSMFTSDFAEEILRMKTDLLNKYEGRDRGTPDKLVGVAITTDETVIALHQQHHAESIVRDGTLDARGVSSPLNPGMDIPAQGGDGEELDTSRYPYATILGKLMFLASMPWPDLSDSVRELARRAGRRACASGVGFNTCQATSLKYPV